MFPVPVIDEGSLAKSLNVTIPASEVEEGLSVVIDIDPDSTIGADILVAKRIPGLPVIFTPADFAIFRL